MKRAIVFIHGLGGNAKTTWGLFPELIKNDPYLGKNYDIDLYGYSTKLFSLPFFNLSPRVQRLAEGLKTFLNNRYSDYDEVTLVCHSLGGLVARQYVLDQTLDLVLRTSSNNDTVKIRRLLLYATPNTGSEIANVGKSVTWWQPQIKQACKDSDFITTLNKLWLLLLNKQNLLTPVTFIVGDKDNIVSTDSARPEWVNNYSPTIPEASHTDIVKPKGYGDDRYLTLRRILLKEDFQINSARQDLPVNYDPVIEPVAFFSKLLRSKIAWSTMAMIAILTGAFLVKQYFPKPPPTPKPSISESDKIKISLENVFAQNEDQAKKWLKEKKKLYGVDDKALVRELENTLPLRPEMAVEDYARWARETLDKNEVISKLRELSEKKNPPFHTFGEETDVEYGNWEDPLIALVPKEYPLNEKVVQVSYQSRSIVVHACNGIPPARGSLKIQVNKQAWDELLGTENYKGNVKRAAVIWWNAEDVPNLPAAKVTCPKTSNKAR
ncbi:MAG: alpha/beta hydrolase [Acidobacteriota bacterium]|nr:alpha/beta hydrolase [Acidobacteriota bacterium]